MKRTFYPQSFMSEMIFKAQLLPNFGFILLLLIALLFSQSTISQSMEWGYNIGDWNTDIPVDMDKTSNGVIVTTTTSNEVKGLHRYDSEGNLLWQFNAFENLPRGEYTNYNFLETVVDENDFTYTLLSFKESTNVINGITIYRGLSLLKIDPYGNLVWSEKLSELISESDINLVLNKGSLFVLGIFQDTVTIHDEITFTSKLYWDCYSHIYRHGNDYYIAKFDLEGTLQDAISFGTDYHDRLAAVTIDEDSNIYFAGGSEFHGGCSDNYTHITKYNGNLELQWEKQISNEENGSQLIYPSNLYYSQSSGSLFMWGYNLGEIEHVDYNIPVSPCYSRGDALGAGANLFEFLGDSGSFVKYRHYPNCTVNPVWHVGGNYSNRSSNKAGIAEFGEELIILSSLQGSMEFDNGIYQSTHVYSDINGMRWDENVFLMRVSKKDFQSVFVTNFPGEDNNDYPQSIDNPNRLILDSGYLYLSASFQANPIHVFGSPIDNNSGNNASDCLIAKVRFDTLLSTNDASKTDQFNIFPNPASEVIHFNSSQDNISNIKVYTLYGSLVKEIEPESGDKNLNVSELKSGIYFVKFESWDNTSTVKKLVIE